MTPLVDDVRLRLFSRAVDAWAMLDGASDDIVVLMTLVVDDGLNVVEAERLIDRGDAKQEVIQSRVLFAISSERRTCVSMVLVSRLMSRSEWPLKQPEAPLKRSHGFGKAQY